MNRRYIDFVPSKPMEKKTSAGSERTVRETRVVRETKVIYKATPAKKAAPAAKPVAKPAVKPVARPVVKPAAKPVAKASVSAKAGASGFSIKNEPKLGVVEDLQPKFIRTEVEKRPLSDGKVRKDTLKEAKAKKIGLRKRLKNTEKTEEKVAEKVENTEVKEKAQTFKPPKTPFINQDKVVKRPLSKNVYTKKIEEPKGEPEGTVTIIAKPKKDKHVSFVVAIIVTIILGAAAGTIAFLLLPK